MASRETTGGGGAQARRRGTQALGALVGRVLDPVVARRGFAATELITRWEEIAGAELARYTRPEQIHWPREGREDGEPGVLILRVSGPAAVEVQHLAPQILERINAYFGWRAIGSLRLRQGPISTPERRGRQQPRALTVAEQAAINARVAGIDHEGLREALAALGRAALGAVPPRG